MAYTEWKEGKAMPVTRNEGDNRGQHIRDRGTEKGVMMVRRKHYVNGL